MSFDNSPFGKRIDQNAAGLLDAILHYGPISRQDLMRRTHLGQVKVNQIVSELLETGFLQANELGRSKGGRRPQLLQISDRLGYILGVEIYPDFITALLVDVNFNIVCRIQKPAVVEKADRISRFESTKKTIHELIDRSGISPEEILAIGLACPGTLNISEGVVVSSSTLGSDWHGKDVPIRVLIENEFNLPVFLEHNAKAMALAERRLGAAQGVDDFILVTVSIGVGAGIITGGRVLRGTAGFSGEFGHITVDEKGPRCSCGHIGCLQALVSTPAAIAYVRNALKQGTRSKINDLIGGNLKQLSFEKICIAAEQGDRLASIVIERMGLYLGKTIAMMVLVLNPKQVVLSREAVLAGDLLLDRIRHIVKLDSLMENSECVEIMYSSLGANAAPLGVASVVRDHLFELIPIGADKLDLNLDR